jgi:RNA polymerase sigma-70 factor (ECF subfamily)
LFYLKNITNPILPKSQFANKSLQGVTVELLTEIQENNSQESFHTLYKLYYDHFFRTAYYYLKNQDFAQEVVLDVFMILWNKRTELCSIKDFDRYCFILIKHNALNYMEKENLRATDSVEDIANQVMEQDHTSPEELLLDEELFAHYLIALNNLPDRCKEVFLLVREEKKSYAEVAELLNVSIKTVDAQLQKATKRLKSDLSDYLEK